jgi:hypothetical protein
MPNTGYDHAFEQATDERTEIRVQIERLLTRGEMLDKLLECLGPFVSNPKPVEENSAAFHQAATSGHSEQHHEHYEHHEHHQG